MYFREDFTVLRKRIITLWHILCDGKKNKQNLCYPEKFFSQFTAIHCLFMKQFFQLRTFCPESVRRE